MTSSTNFLPSLSNMTALNKRFTRCVLTAMILCFGLLKLGISQGQALNPALSLPPSDLAPAVYFVNLKDGDKLRSPFRVVFGLSRLGLAPAGVDLPVTGHHHLLINTPLPRDLTKPIPFSDKYRHFGGGQSEAVLELAPGKHTLQLLFADHKHRPFVKAKSGEDVVVFSKQITIEVLQ